MSDFVSLGQAAERVVDGLRERLTAKRLREVLDYDPMTGIFRWKKTLSPTGPRGHTTGSKSDGYLQIRVDGRLYQAHRLAWLYAFGEWPEGHLDHINRIRDDNRIGNLRLATRSQNQWNSPKRRNNKSGRKGTWKHPIYNRYRARITVFNKKIHLGYFDTPEEAHFAYCEAARKFFGEFARME